MIDMAQQYIDKCKLYPCDAKNKLKHLFDILFRRCASNTCTEFSNTCIGMPTDVKSAFSFLHHVLTESMCISMFATASLLPIR